MKDSFILKKLSIEKLFYIKFKYSKLYILNINYNITIYLKTLNEYKIFFSKKKVN